MEKKVLILGKGISGKAAQNLLNLLGYKTILWDEKDSFDILKDKYEFIVKSPGIPPYKDFLKILKSKIISELDLGLINSKGYKIGITGTNGKSTTTLITYLLLETLGEFSSLKTFIGGNYGIPLSEFAHLTDKSSVIVLELSSFQLFDSKYLKFDVGAILNIHEDHISWHRTFSNYMFSKLKLILNSKIRIIEERTYKKCKIAFKNLLKDKNIITFGISPNSSYFLSQDYCIYTPHIKVDLKELNCPEFLQKPFALDLLASLCIFENFVNYILKLDLKKFYNISFIKKAINKYKKLPFRLEKRQLEGIPIYNDSKSTNPHSVECALRAVNDRVILIMGGKDKGLCFNNLIPLIKKKVFKVFLFGEAKVSIYKQLKNLPNIKVCSSLEEALDEAIKLAKKHNLTILFSPGCSSFDRFKNYLERGRYFDKLLEKYKNVYEEISWIK